MLFQPDRIRVNFIAISAWNARRGGRNLYSVRGKVRFETEFVEKGNIAVDTQIGVVLRVRFHMFREIVENLKLQISKSDLQMSNVGDFVT